MRIRNVAKCPKCAVKGDLKLTGGSVSASLSLICGKCFMVKGRREAEAIEFGILKNPMHNVNTAVGVHEHAVVAQDTNRHGKYVLEKAIKMIENAEKRIMELEETAKNSSNMMTVLEAKVRALEEENRILREHINDTKDPPGWYSG